MKLPILAAALAGTMICAASAEAQTVAALVGDNMIALIDVQGRKVEKTMTVSGMTGRILGIDVRPADGMLYALAADGTVATIDPSSGKATMKSKLETMLPADAMASVDFNPVADRLRVIGSNGMNLRANVDDGKVTQDGMLKFADGDMHKGKAPRVVAGAYTNAMKGAKETALFDIDATGVLVKQAPPNDGILNSVGMTGMPAEAVAFDIVSADGANDAWLMVGDSLHKVDLMTGKAGPAMKVSGLGGPVRDIAAMQKAM